MKDGRNRVIALLSDGDDTSRQLQARAALKCQRPDDIRMTIDLFIDTSSLRVIGLRRRARTRLQRLQDETCNCTWHTRERLGRNGARDLTVRLRTCSSPNTHFHSASLPRPANRRLVPATLLLRHLTLLHKYYHNAAYASSSVECRQNVQSLSPF